MKKILIVDDELDLTVALVSMFEDSGWTVESASNGQEALEKVDSFNPNVIISDIHMPVMNGLEMLESIFRQGLLIPVVLLTGYRDAEKVKRAQTACAYDFLDKPFMSKTVLLMADIAFEFGKDHVLNARKAIVA